MLLIKLEGVLLSMVTSSSFVVDDTWLLQLVQRWLHRRVCSSSESVIILLRLDSLVVLWILRPTWAEMLAGGTVSNCFDLTPHDKLVAPFFGRLGLVLGYVVWIYLNIFESERYFGIKNQGMNRKWHFLGKKGETLSTLWIKQRGDRSKKVS